jgi:hypothetical protein
MSIIEIVTRDWEDIDQEILHEYSVSEDYIKASENLDKIYEQIDEKFVEIIQENFSSQVAIIQDTAYNKGFADAVKLMAACMK